MTKTPKPNSSSTTPPTATPPPPPKPLHPPQPPREYTLLARFMQSASYADRMVLLDILKDLASPTGLPMAETLLEASSRTLGLGLFVEGITEYAEDFRGFSRVILDGGWLYRCLNLVFTTVNKGFTLTPEDLMHMAEIYLLEMENNIDGAREVIKNYPEAVAEEIRAAVNAQPELLNLS